MERENKKKSDGVIVALYNYRHKTGNFPLSLNELPGTIDSTTGSYFPDPTYQKFDFYYRDLYGFPHVFSSKDSSWTR